MKKSVLIFLFLSFSVSVFCQEQGILFQFKHHKGDAVSHISTVEEQAYLNGRLNNKTQFINRTSTTVKEVAKDGSATLYTHYMTTQNSLTGNSKNYLSWGEEDYVTIHRTKDGELYNSDNEFLPTVRCVPSFKDKPIKKGESWSCGGLEVHDCRQLFNMTGPVSIPFVANYTFKDEIEQNGSTLQIIEVYYTFRQNDFSEMEVGSTYAGASGYARQKIYWDNQKGDIDHFEEEFEIKLYDLYSNTYLFKGMSKGEVTEYKSANDDETVKELQKTIDDNELENVTVKRGEQGLTISLENIQFEPDSDILLPSEKEKLNEIAKLLKDFSNDLLITGHCAERGTVKARQTLSELRAKAVADYLVQLGVRDEYHVFTQGKGSTQPVASNSTEEGRIKNRRVEIILID